MIGRIKILYVLLIGMSLMHLQSEITLKDQVSAIFDKHVGDQLKFKNEDEYNNVFRSAGREGITLLEGFEKKHPKKTKEIRDLLFEVYAFALKDFDKSVGIMKKYFSKQESLDIRLALIEAFIYLKKLKKSSEWTQLENFIVESKKIYEVKAKEKLVKLETLLFLSDPVGEPFPEFLMETKDTNGKKLSIKDYRGKVLLLDFWATWCGPCVKELPNVLNVYNNYHKKGFDILGISLDKSESSLERFIKKHKMPWRQYYDGKGWENKVARRYGIRSIPATFLLDSKGVVRYTDLRGSALGQKVNSLLTKNK